MKIDKLFPPEVFKAFDEISHIPRNSGAESTVINFIADKASQVGFTHWIDATGNLLVSIPANDGWEETPSICLQSHVDMVCVKDEGVTHDFEHDPIKIADFTGPNGEKGVCAQGTSLGADNGIGVAMMIAMMNSADAHGPLELLFTVDEEENMTGINNLGFRLNSRLFINLDGDKENAVYIGSASFTNILAKLEMARTFVLKEMENLAHPTVITVSVIGLASGHSGLQIHRNQGNAIKLITKLLEKISQQTTLLICDINGGERDSVIPANATARFILPFDKNPLEFLQSIAKKLADELRGNLPEEERAFNFILSKESAAENDTCLSTEDSLKLIGALLSIPHGVKTMHPNLPNTVATSSNLAKIKTNNDTVGILLSVRSCFDDESSAFTFSIALALTALGFKTQSVNIAPAWQPNLGSKLLKKARESYIQCFFKEPVLIVDHAGLETAVISKKYPDMEIISIGPNIHDAHTANEWLEIDSVSHSWEFLWELLESF